MKNNPRLHPLDATAAVAVDPERGALDWPFHAGIVENVLDRIDTKVRQRRTRRRRLVARLSAAAAVIAILVWAVPFVRDTSSVATLAAQRQTLTLADGSHADLNARSSLHTDFRYGRRTVQLERGEAFFSVAKDAAHPFLVETPAGTVRVTGTQFNVRIGADGAAEVTLLEGAVTMLRDGGESARLIPGQQFDSAQSGLRTLSAADLKNVTAWREGRLALDGLTLATAAERFGEYHGHQLVVAPEVAGLRLGGSAPLDNLNAFLAALPETLPVRVLPQGDGSFRITAR